MSTHEDLQRGREIKGGSDRSFGFVFAAVFALAGMWPKLHGRPVRFGWLAASALFLAVTLIRASALAPLNRLWTRLGALLNRVVSPVISALVFYLVVTPLGMMMRWGGKDPLHLKPDPQAESYWVRREPPGPEPASMANQF